jgi:electron transport complex protein RnfE
VKDDEFGKGLLRENPLFVSLLGLCPALAVSDLVSKALAMGAGVTLVLAAAGAAISALRRIVPERPYPLVCLALVAALVSLLDLGMRAIAPALRQGLGVYLELIAVNCLVLGRMERFARHHSPLHSVWDALGMGIGFTAALVLMAVIREALGSGTITLFPAGGFDGVIRIPALSRYPARVMSMAAGALLLLGYLAGLAGWLKRRRPWIGQRSSG